VIGEAQARIMVFISEFIEENGWSPTIREIQAALGYASPSTVYTHLERLRLLGYLEGTGRRLRLGWRAKGQDAGVG